MELQDVIGYCEDTATCVGTGDLNALQGFADMRAVIAAAQDALKEIEELALAEAEKYPGKTFEHGGLTFTRTEGKRAFKFDHLKEWADTKRTLSTIEERAKNAALQMEKKLVLASDDGEVFEPAIITYGKPSLSISKVK